MGRSLHAACCLNYGEEHPQLLVSGGLDKGDNALRDFWVLDVEAGTWKEMSVIYNSNTIRIQVSLSECHVSVYM